MAVPYNHREVEKKWQTVWDDEKAFKTSDDFSKPKYLTAASFHTISEIFLIGSSRYSQPRRGLT